MLTARLYLRVVRCLSMGFFIASVFLAVWQMQLAVEYTFVAMVSMVVYLLACLGEGRV